MLDQVKMIAKMNKARKELANEIIEVEVANGAVIVRIAADQKVKSIELDPERIDLDDIAEVQRWLTAAMNEAISKSQQVAAEKMKPLMSGLGMGGF